MHSATPEPELLKDQQVSSEETVMCRFKPFGKVGMTFIVMAFISCYTMVLLGLHAESPYASEMSVQFSAETTVVSAVRQFYSQTGEMPENLDTLMGKVTIRDPEGSVREMGPWIWALPRNPHDGSQYEYRKLSDDTFELNGEIFEVQYGNRGWGLNISC